MSNSQQLTQQIEHAFALRRFPPDDRILSSPYGEEYDAEARTVWQWALSLKDRKIEINELTTFTHYYLSRAAYLNILPKVMIAHIEHFDRWSMDFEHIFYALSEWPIDRETPPDTPSELYLCMSGPERLAACTFVEYVYSQISDDEGDDDIGREVGEPYYRLARLLRYFLDAPIAEPWI